ncbi:MAG: XdhC family protein [Ferruginibacter sp.]
MNEVWTFIKKKLDASMNVVLLYVLESEGSSPGRKGFKMAVAADDDFCGTIGGGIMEFKSVEKAKNLLKQHADTVLLMRQYHDKEHTHSQSGMICSGSQLNVFIPLKKINLISKIENIIKALEADAQITIQLSPQGLDIVDQPAAGFKYSSPETWSYTELLNHRPVIHIIGGGHIGLALSEMMHFLGFHIKLYDDRPELNTIEANSFADEKFTIDYEKSGKSFVNVQNEYAVIMTIGYRTDKIVLRQLLDKDFFYLGLLGSQHKIETLFAELKEEGISEDALKKIYSPVGIEISSKTTHEIAVSIAAEIIKKKNA